MRALGALCILGGVSIVGDSAFVFREILRAVRRGGLSGEYAAVTQMAALLASALALAAVVLTIVLGIRLLRGDRRSSRRILEAGIVCAISVTLCLIMLFGMSGYLVVPGVVLAAKIALLSYIDPALAEERRLQRRLRTMEARSDAEDGALGLDETGRGYVRLDYFNISGFSLSAACLASRLRSHITCSSSISASIKIVLACCGASSHLFTASGPF